MTGKAERMKTAVGAYFAACDATRERIPLKNGGFEERQIPYTLYGLARAVQMPPDELIRRAKAGRGEIGRLLADAVLRIAAYTTEHALLGELTYQVALETVRSMGFGQSDGGDAVTTVVLDERLARYAK